MPAFRTLCCCLLALPAIFKCSAAGLPDADRLTKYESESVSQNESFGPIPAKYRPFLERGQQAKLSDQEIIALLNEFERDLAKIYRELGDQLSPILGKEAITSADKEQLVTTTQNAGRHIVDATKSVLRPLGLSDAELASLIPHFSYFSTSTKLAIRRAYPGANEDVRDEVIMSQPVSLLYLMAGLSRRVGIYVDIEGDNRIIGNAFLISFPRYYFSRDGSEQSIPLREDIKRFLTTNSFRKFADELYTSKQVLFPMVVLKSSSSYSLEGVADNYGTYGENDTLDGRDRILIFEGNIRHRTRKFSDQWRKHLQNRVEIHEIMHALHREQRRTCLNSGVDKSIVGDLDEVQAQTAALGILANENDASLAYNLTMARNGSWSKHAEFIYNDFYSGILQRVLRAKFKAIRAKTESTSISEKSKLPAYFQIGSQTAQVPGAPGPDVYALGTLKVAGEEKNIIADIAHMDSIIQMDLLFDATSEDVLEEVHTALTRVAEIEAGLCKSPYK